MDDPKTLREKVEATVSHPETVVRTPDWRRAKMQCNYHSTTCREPVVSWFMSLYGDEEMYACKKWTEWAMACSVHKNTTFHRVRP
jgi:hypothetical protein